ncbi:MAG: hypothetical protein NTV45_02375, partial [Firmicutes bacterium]|nr:hypothetical protein [Bacillota bacterium]
MNRELFDKIKNNWDQDKDVLLSGLSGTARSFFLHELFRQLPGRLLCIVSGEEQAYDLVQALKPWVGQDKIWLFLERDFIFRSENASRTALERIATLQDLIF